MRQVFLWVICAFTLAPHAEGRPRVEAYAGHPFGVGKVTVDVPRGEPIPLLGDDRFAIDETAGRVLYPALEATPVRGLLREVLAMEMPRRVTFYFLFRGEEPLSLRVYAPQMQVVEAVPVRPRPRQLRTLLEVWWAEYLAHYRRIRRRNEYPLLVQSYLVTSLAQRLRLSLPEDNGAGLFQRDQINRALGLLLGTESIRAALRKDVLLSDARLQELSVADQPLPAAIEPPTVDFPDVPSGTEVEPIALHVPHECFYVRFGNFPNYLWLRDLTKRWGGDLANMIAVRSIDYGTNALIEEQLALKESALAKVLGPAVIQDVALIGTDTFVREGAAVGILFHARNNLALGSDIRRQRREALASRDDAAETIASIGGKDVSYLSTPHGEIRSYYVQDGDFHLVTTSRYVARRFIEAGQGRRSLGASTEFRYARSLMPTTRDDTVFIYLSDAFFRLLVSPQYRIEMTRRMQSLVEIETAHIAPLAARAEGVEAAAVGELIASGLLPRGFGSHIDGSRLVSTAEGWIDSLRGSPGRFLPIPDVNVQAVTRREAAEYEAFRQLYEGEWQQIDPVIAAIGRRPLDKAGWERIAIDLLVTPFHEASYGWIARNLGPPTHARLRPVPGDVISLEGWVRVGGLLDRPWQKRVHHVFGGLRDFRSPLAVRRGDVTWKEKPEQFVRGYLGSRPPLRLLDFLFPTDSTAADDDGYEPPRPTGNAWQRRLGDMAILSFKRDVLENVTPQLELVRAERPAQVRLRVSDLSNKAISELINAFGYKRAREVSASATRFINSLHQQLHVPRAESRAVAEHLIGGTFTCPLGGEYELLDVPEGLPTWISTAMTPQNRWLLMEVPEDYRFPFLEWFRGLSAELTLREPTLRAHIEIDVQHPAAAAGPAGLLPLPALGLPSGQSEPQVDGDG